MESRSCGISSDCRVGKLIRKTYSKIAFNYGVTHLVCEKFLLTKFHHFAWAVAQLVATVLAARQLLELPKPKLTRVFTDEKVL